MASPLEHQMTVESPTNGQPPAAAAAATSAERDSLPQLRNGRWIALGADEATFGSMVGMRTPTPAARRYSGVRTSTVRMPTTTGFVARAPRPFTRPGMPPKPPPALTPKPAPTSGREPNDVGPGLIDTTFEYRDLQVHGGDTTTLSFTVSNTGRRRARRGPPTLSRRRPRRPVHAPARRRTRRTRTGHIPNVRREPSRQVVAAWVRVAGAWRVRAQCTMRSSWGVVLRRRPPSSVTVTMSSIRTPKRPGR